MHTAACNLFGPNVSTRPLQMRVILHGPFKMAAEHAQLLLLSTRDPYNVTEHLDCQSTQFSLQYDTGGCGEWVGRCGRE